MFTPISTHHHYPDLCNHAAGSKHILTGRAAPGGQLKVTAGADVAVGEEVAFAYGGGRLPSDRFLQDYGFLDADEVRFRVIVVTKEGVCVCRLIWFLMILGLPYTHIFTQESSRVWDRKALAAAIGAGQCSRQDIEALANVTVPPPQEGEGAGERAALAREYVRRMKEAAAEALKGLQ